MKKSITTIVVIIMIIVLAVGGYALFHKKPPKTVTISTHTTTSATVPKTSSRTATDTTIVLTKTSSSNGSYLTNSSGYTLYTYGGDTKGVSNCTGSCLASWPAYAPTTSTASLPTNVTIIKRSDGTSQYAYQGLPLYTFTGDTSPGQVTGVGVADFHLVTP